MPGLNTGTTRHHLELPDKVGAIKELLWNGMKNVKSNEFQTIDSSDMSWH